MTDGYEEFTGTRPVDERLRFDLGPLETWMRARVEGVSCDLTVEQFKGGQSNPTYPPLRPRARRGTCCARSRPASSCPRPTRWSASTG